MEAGSFVEMVVGVVACRPSGLADLSSRARRGPGLGLVRCVSTRLLGCGAVVDDAGADLAVRCVLFG